MKVGIFFGGQSREREISFMGARTVWECIDKSLFEPVPIFIDSLGNFIKIDAKFLYAENIRAFYPPKNYIPKSFAGFDVYVECLENLSQDEFIKLMNQVGEPIKPQDFKKYIDFAFILLHGTYGEDGTIQGLLEMFHVPYSGCGIMGSANSANKLAQKQILSISLPNPPKKYISITKTQWSVRNNRPQLLEHIKKEIGLPAVIKAPNQGSSIGVFILKTDDIATFEKALNTSFFMVEIEKKVWKEYSPDDKKKYVQNLIELDKSIGMPVLVADKTLLGGKLGEITCYKPHELIEKIDDIFSYSDSNVLLSSFDSEEIILVEEFVKGKEFSCGVIQDEEGNPIGLPPTEIGEDNQYFDFDAKYKLPTRKKIPVEVSTEQVEKIKHTCEKIFQSLDYGVCCRIDGFSTPEEEIFIIDTNTIPGMSPVSLIFRQVAEIGLNPTQFITYMIRYSLLMRIRSGKRPYHLRNLLSQLENKMNEALANPKPILSIIVPAFGEKANEALVEGRKKYNQTASEGKFTPQVVLLTENADKSYSFWDLPISYLLKTSIGEVVEDLLKPTHPAIKTSIEKSRTIRNQFLRSFFANPQAITLEEISKRSAQTYIAQKEYYSFLNV